MVGLNNAKQRSILNCATFDMVDFVKFNQNNDLHLSVLNNTMTINGGSELLYYIICYIIIRGVYVFICSGVVVWEKMVKLRTTKE